MSLLADLCLQSGPLLDRVFATYKLMHTQQTVDFVRKKVLGSFLACQPPLPRSNGWMGGGAALIRPISWPC